MEEINQVQKAGKEAQQYQIGNITINSGITEERARAVFNEMIPQALANYTQEAYKTANERVNKLEERIMPRLEKVEGLLPSFADPAFHVLLRKAQNKAAVTERESDYDLLTELLICHVQKGNDRKKRVGIDKAIEIIDFIDNDALCALTIAFVTRAFLPVTGNVEMGISILNQMYQELIYEKLPVGDSWMDHLDILGTIRITPFSSVNKIEEIIANSLDGYVAVGIKRDSADYFKATQLLQTVGLSNNILVANEFLQDYVKLEIRNVDAISQLSIINDKISRPINQKEVDILKEIVKLYDDNSELKTKVKEKFFLRFDSYDSLKKLHEWWNSIEGSFSITEVGRIIAYINAKRCIPELPDILA